MVAPTQSQQSTSSRPRRGQILRRATDPTLLEGPARPLTRGAVFAALIGSLLAMLGPFRAQPVAFTLSSVVAIGLLGAARRSDTAGRPDHLPDRSLRTYLAAVGIVALALLGTVLSAWQLAESWAR